MISWFRTTFGDAEINMVKQAILNEHISQGIVTEELENMISHSMGGGYVVATTSGSVALVMALMALGVKPGDEVIVPNRTWIATAHAPLLVGAKVVLAEVRDDIPQFDMAKLKNKINQQTKAIIPVHLNGRSEDINELKKLTTNREIFIVEDAAQAFFSQNSDGYLGTQSDIGCFSLGVTKLIATGQGGFLFTRKREIFNTLTRIRWHGTLSNIEPEYSFLGCNFKFNDILASIGLAQMQRASEKVSHLNRIYSMYSDGLSYLDFIKIIPVQIQYGEIPLYVECLCNDRNDMLNYLQSNGIEARPALPNLDSAPHLGNKESYPNSDIYSRHALILPCGPGQPLENVQKTIFALRKF